LIPARTHTIRFANSKFEPGFEAKRSSAVPQRTGSASHWHRILEIGTFPTELSDLSLSSTAFHRNLLRSAGRLIRLPSSQPDRISALDGQIGVVIWIIARDRNAGGLSATVVLSG
jgi:hypothetical protein